MSLATRITAEFLADADRTKALAGEAMTAFGEAFARAFSGVVIDVTAPEYGAGPDKTGAENRVAFQAAIDYAYSLYFLLGQIVTVYVPPGLYLIELESATWWTIPTPTVRDFHAAIKLRSGVFLRGEPGGGTVLTPEAYAGSASTDYYAVFAREEETGILTSAIDLESIGFENITFDYTDEVWPDTHGAIYGVMAIGVDGFKMVRCKAELSTGTAGSVGRLGRVMNCSDVVVDDFECANISQGLYISYCERLWLRGRVTGAREGIDIDQVAGTVFCWLEFSDGTGSEQQALDVSGVTDGYFWLTGSNFGSCGNIYTKPDGPPTFAEWLTDFPSPSTLTATPAVPRRIFFSARCNNVHSNKYRSLQVSLRRDDTFGVGYWDGIDCVSDVTLDVALEDADPIQVNECDNIQGSITVRNSNIGSETPVDEANNAAVIMRSEHLEGLVESRLSGKLLITVEDCQYGGVLILAPTDLDISGSSVRGYNSAEHADSNFGFKFGRLLVKPGRLTIADLTASGGDLTVQPNDLKLAYDSTTSPIGETLIVDRGGHRFTSGATTPVSAPSSGATFARLQQGIVSVAIDTVANAGQTVLLAGAPVDGGRLLYADVINAAAVPQGGGAGANRTALSMRRWRAGAVGSAIGTAVDYDQAAVAAGTVTGLGVSGSDVDGLFAAGDIPAIQGTRVGTGSVLAAGNLFVRFAMLEWYAS